MDRIIPRLVWIERMIRPRYWPFWRRRGDRVVGIIALIMAIPVTLPIPLGNWLPAFSTALLGLALSERDGILFALGSAVGLAAMALVASVIGAGCHRTQPAGRLLKLSSDSSCTPGRANSLAVRIARLARSAVWKD